MRIKILNDGGFVGFKGVYFPALVDAEFFVGADGRLPHFNVSAPELKRIGARYIPSSGLGFTLDEIEVVECKVKLLNDGGFSGLSKVSFPLEVPAHSVDVRGTRAMVDAAFMVSVGARISSEDIGTDDYYLFIDGEFEVVE